MKICINGTNNFLYYYHKIKIIGQSASLYKRYLLVLYRYSANEIAKCRLDTWLGTNEQRRPLKHAD